MSIGRAMIIFAHFCRLSYVLLLLSAQTWPEMGLVGIDHDWNCLNSCYFGDDDYLYICCLSDLLWQNFFDFAGLCMWSCLFYCCFWSFRLMSSTFIKFHFLINLVNLRFGSVRNFFHNNLDDVHSACNLLWFHSIHSIGQDKDH